MENEKEPQRITVYKGTDKDMKCRGMQYEVGKTVESDGAIRCGDKGFHSCEAPLDVLRYYGPANGNRFFEAEAGGKIDRRGADDSKIASSELTIKAEIGLSSLIKAQVEYTRKKAANAGGDRSTNAGGYRSTNAGGDWSTNAGGYLSTNAGGDWSTNAGGYLSTNAGGYLSTNAGGDRSTNAGGDWSTNAGGDRSTNAGGNRSTNAGGDRSTNAGGDRSTNAGGDWSTNAGGYRSTNAGGDRSTNAGGDRSTNAGGKSSVMIGRNGSKAKGGKNSVIVLTEWEWRDEEYVPVCVKAEVVDGERIKADVFYTLKDGELVEVKEEK